MTLPAIGRLATVLDRIGDVEQRWLLASYDDPSKLTLSLPEQIANKLVEAVIKGTLKAGQRLQETAIAEQFAVSRGSIREALRILEREGLVVIRPRHGASVAILSPQDLADIFEVRALLFGLAARKLAQHPTDEILSYLAAAQEALKATIDDPDKFLPLVYRCSMYVAETAGNQLGRGILFSLGRQTLSVTRLALMPRENRVTWIENWAASVAAIRCKRPAEAEAAMRRLAETVGDSAVAVLRRQENGEEGRASYG